MTPSANPNGHIYLTRRAFFLDNHTAHVSAPAGDECPVCLEPYTAEPCVRITGIPGCTHTIGLTCLHRILDTGGTSEVKRCPICRAAWVSYRTLAEPRERVTRPPTLDVPLPRADFRFEMNEFSRLARDIEDVRARAGRSDPLRARTGDAGVGIFGFSLARRAGGGRGPSPPSTPRAPLVEGPFRIRENLTTGDSTAPAVQNSDAGEAQREAIRPQFSINLTPPPQMPEAFTFSTSAATVTNLPQRGNVATARFSLGAAPSPPVSFPWNDNSPSAVTPSSFSRREAAPTARATATKARRKDQEAECKALEAEWKDFEARRDDWEARLKGHEARRKDHEARRKDFETREEALKDKSPITERLRIQERDRDRAARKAVVDLRLQRLEEGERECSARKAVLDLRFQRVEEREREVKAREEMARKMEDLMWKQCSEIGELRTKHCEEMERLLAPE